MGRHWRHGELFVETLPGPVAGPVEDVVDALEVLEELARSDASVTHERPLSLVDDLQR